MQLVQHKAPCVSLADEQFSCAQPLLSWPPPRRLVNLSNGELSGGGGGAAIETETLAFAAPRGTHARTHTRTSLFCQPSACERSRGCCVCWPQCAVASHTRCKRLIKSRTVVREAGGRAARSKPPASQQQQQRRQRASALARARQQRARHTSRAHYHLANNTESVQPRAAICSNSAACAYFNWARARVRNCCANPPIERRDKAAKATATT